MSKSPVNGFEPDILTTHHRIPKEEYASRLHGRLREGDRSRRRLLFHLHRDARPYPGHLCLWPAKKLFLSGTIRKASPEHFLWSGR
jgi:hypothetical protein